MRSGTTAPCRASVCGSNMRLRVSSVRVVSKMRYAIHNLIVPMVSWKPQLVCTIYGFVIASVVCDDEPKTLFLITSTLPVAKPMGKSLHFRITSIFILERVRIYPLRLLSVPPYQQLGLDHRVPGSKHIFCWRVWLL